jgi:hypothetical protein
LLLFSQSTSYAVALAYRIGIEERIPKYFALLCASWLYIQYDTLFLTNSLHPSRTQPDEYRLAFALHLFPPFTISSSPTSSSFSSSLTSSIMWTMSVKSSNESDQTLDSSDVIKNCPSCFWLMAIAHSGEAEDADPAKLLKAARY